MGVSPLSVSFSDSYGRPNDRVGVYTPDFAYADNSGSGGEGSYSIDAAHGGPSSGPVIGSVTGDMSGTLLCYFHMYWSGPGPQPGYATFLVNTSLYAEASVSYEGSQLPGGLSATATATDGELNETASASAGSGASSGGVPTVSGYHLVRAAVDPNTGVAEVYVSGTTHWALSNMVPYQATPPYASYGAATAYGGSLVQAGAIPDSRDLTILRDGAHNETIDTDGTVHGDTTFSYNTSSGPVQNVQVFHPNFAGGWSPNPNYISTGTGPLFNISWQWNPQNQTMGQTDTWQDHRQNIDIGTSFPEGSPQQWFGPADKVKVVNISYTATDLGTTPNATAVGNYVLSIHDQYDNWRRVDTQGNPMSLSAAGDPGSLDQLGQTTTPLPATPVLTIHDAGVDWNVVGDTGGGALSGTSILLMALPEPPTCPAAVLALAGLTVQTISALPTDPHQVSPPSGVTFDASALQTAYQNYVNDKTAQPGEENHSNLVDTNFALSLANNPDFQGYDNGNYGTVSVTATVYQQMLDYYFYADEYDTGGLITHTAPSTVHKPGGYVWNYLWTYAGTVTPPSNPTA